MKKNGNYVTVTLTFDPRSSKSIGFEPVQEATIQRKPCPNRCIRSAGILFTRNSGHTDRQTDRHTRTQTNCSENITPPRFRGGVKIVLTAREFFFCYTFATKGSYSSSLTALNGTLDFLSSIVTYTAMTCETKYFHFPLK